MLRISTVDSGTQRQLIVEGKLIAPWAAELKAACKEATTELSGRELIVDLRNLIVINQEGENVVLELMRKGVKFHGSGVYADYILRILAAKARGEQQDRC